jgi:hypothetical protein
MFRLVIHRREGRGRNQPSWRQEVTVSRDAQVAAISPPVNWLFWARYAVMCLGDLNRSLKRKITYNQNWILFIDRPPNLFMNLL